MAELTRIKSPGGAAFTVAQPHAERFSGLLGDLEAAGYKVNGDQSGGYNYRTIAGTNKLSNHAHGAAIDVNWTDNARGTPGNIPPDLARALAQKHGLTWGGDWKNPDPMHFEVPGQPGHTYGDGHNHGAAPTQQSTPTGAPAMAAPALTPYDGPSPDDVAMQRKLAMSLMQQGTSAEPVGHWTQALARVLQGGVGGMYQNQAMEGEKQGRNAGNAALVQALNGGDPKAAVSGMLSNPYTNDAGQKLALGVLQGQLAPKHKFIQGRDGIVYWGNEQTGELQNKSGPGNLSSTLSPGEKSLDQSYAKDHADFIQGGYADAERGLKQMRSVIGEVKAVVAGKTPADMSGPTIGRLPDAVNAYFNPRAVDIKDRIGEQTQRNLRAILGAQFTQKEGDALIARAWNPVLGEKTNLQRIEALTNSMEKMLKSKKDMAAYFEEKGTLKGFKGSTRFTVDDLIQDAGLDAPDPKGNAAPPSTPGVSVGQAPTPLPSGTYNWSGETGTVPAAPQQAQQQVQPSVPVPQPMQRGPGGAASYRGAVMPEAALPPPPEMRRMTPQEAAALRAQGLNEYGIPIRGIR